MPRPGTDFDETEHPAVPESHPLIAASEAVGTTTLWGFDYAWESDTPAQLVRLLQANSADFVARYVTDPGGKGMLWAEAQAMIAVGIMLFPVWEVTGTDFVNGYGAGLADGKAAATAMRHLGAPGGSLLWFAIDTGTTDFGSTNAYLRGCKVGSAEYIAQLYGSYDVVEAAAAAGLGSWHWQTYAWSAGKLSSHALLYQYQNGVTIGGISMDRDRTLKAVSGPWAHTETVLPLPAPEPTPTPIPTPIQRRKGMLIFEVSRQLCTDQGVRWPGVFLLSGQALHHITASATDSAGKFTSNVVAYLMALGQPALAVITPAEFEALGGTLVKIV